VSRSLHVSNGGNIVFISPKMARKRRTVALPPSAVSVLREHREKQEAMRAMLGIPLKDDDLVFSDLESKPLLPNTVTHACIRAVRRRGLKSIRLHDARHTHASLMLKQKAHPKIVQERLGQASVQITLDTYSHVTPRLQQASAQFFDEAFIAKYNEPEKQAAEEC
jgi:integrase